MFKPNLIILTMKNTQRNNYHLLRSSNFKHVPKVIHGADHYATLILLKL